MHLTKNRFVAAVAASVTCFLLAGSGISSGEEPKLAIDSDFPGGNILVEKISVDHVDLRPDLRETNGGWFYWYFQVRGAAGKTVTFNFTKENPVGVRGAAISSDEGLTWRWLGKENATKSSFTYAFSEGEDKVRFSFGMPYTQRNLDAFLKGFCSKQPLSREVLCKSKKGRDVELLRVGKIQGEPRHRVLITSRSHACEMMASYTVEGIIQSVLKEDDRGAWFRENVEMMVIPFVDKDGVEDGDQGKNRAPHDHNRDYDQGGLYEETQALLRTVPDWAGGKMRIMLDLHCPYIRGAVHERIYLVGSLSEEMFFKQTAFSRLLERHGKGPLPYHVADNIPFGTSWNTADNYKAGTNGARWAAKIKGVEVAATFELPYANAKGGEVNAESARAFGEDLATAIMEYLKGKEEP